jgi:hypothetical protein
MSRHSDIQRKTRQAVLSGTLKQKPCAVRSSNCRGFSTQAHHLNYNEPFNIMWLCQAHHQAWHRVFIAEELRGEDKTNTPEQTK